MFVFYILYTDGQIGTTRYRHKQLLFIDCWAASRNHRCAFYACMKLILFVWPIGRSNCTFSVSRFPHHCFSFSVCILLKMWRDRGINAVDGFVSCSRVPLYRLFYSRLKWVAPTFRLLSLKSNWSKHFNRFPVPRPSGRTGLFGLWSTRDVFFFIAFPPCDMMAANKYLSVSIDDRKFGDVVLSQNDINFIIRFPNSRFINGMNGRTRSTFTDAKPILQNFPVRLLFTQIKVIIVLKVGWPIAICRFGTIFKPKRQICHRDVNQFITRRNWVGAMYRAMRISSLGRLTSRRYNGSAFDSDDLWFATASGWNAADEHKYISVPVITGTGSSCLFSSEITLRKGHTDGCRSNGAFDIFVEGESMCHRVFHFHENVCSYVIVFM